MKNFLLLAFITVSPDVALLFLRVWLGVGLFVVHGYEKLIGFSSMAERFPDPLRIGQTPGLVIALLADAVCSILVTFGVLTRFCALFIVCSVGVAFLFVWRMSILNVDGEVAYLYLGGYLFLLLTGPGKYSFDYGRRRV